MNRFKIVKGKKKNLNKSGDQETISNTRRFKNFNLLRSKEHEDYTLYASHSTWFKNLFRLTKSENFRKLIKIWYC